MRRKWGWQRQRKRDRGFTYSPNNGKAPTVYQDCDQETTGKGKDGGLEAGFLVQVWAPQELGLLKMALCPLAFPSKVKYRIKHSAGTLQCAWWRQSQEETVTKPTTIYQVPCVPGVWLWTIVKNLPRWRTLQGQRVLAASFLWAVSSLKAGTGLLVSLCPQCPAQGPAQSRGSVPNESRRERRSRQAKPEMRARE